MVDEVGVQMREVAHNQRVEDNRIESHANQLSREVVPREHILHNSAKNPEGALFIAALEQGGDNVVHRLAVSNLWVLDGKGEQDPPQGFQQRLSAACACHVDFNDSGSFIPQKTALGCEVGIQGVRHPAKLCSHLALLDDGTAASAPDSAARSRRNSGMDSWRLVAFLQKWPNSSSKERSHKVNFTGIAQQQLVYETGCERFRILAGEAHATTCSKRILDLRQKALLARLNSSPINPILEARSGNLKTP